MHRTGLTFGTLLAGILVFPCMQASSQQPAFLPGAAHGAQGQLTVMATVVSSVGLVTGPDGEQRMIAANAADPADNVSRLQMVRMVSLTPVADIKAVEKKKLAKKSR